MLFCRSSWLLCRGVWVKMHSNPKPWNLLMWWSLIVPWLFKLCSVLASDIWSVDWVQLNWMSSPTTSSQLTHTPPLPLSYCSSYLSDSSSCPPPFTLPLLTPALKYQQLSCHLCLLLSLKTTIFCSLSLPPCLLCFFFSSLTQLLARYYFIWPLSLCDECLLTNGMLGLNTYKPASATCMCFET